ncbi:GH32 C-terminal domain-containing protein [Cohnella candidum]|uniref:Levanase n=1 Tax=Cohnella candidum TaxID=2674991 RepID=A0A3G3JZR2_9BACL|nr:GH32 C-terminal domain-containing protein [Cohnella candidum]AYQ73738.1 levanase [Cohnella candidum]
MGSRHKRMKIGAVAASAVLLAAAGAIYYGTRVQESANEPALPTGFAYRPDPAYFTEKFRPQYHLSPETGNMSDPNGMVYFEGEYHQFYQHSGQWGHAVSKDLLHWEQLPLAIAKDDLGDIWSGSAVVDRNDTTGFFGGKPGLVAIFTHFKNGVQSQSIAYSADKGRTWTKYAGNPVIPNPNVKDFRDPKVFWHEATKSWVMVVSVDQKVWFYRSPDLKNWTRSGEFGLGHGSHAAVWECPDLFELPVEGSGEKKWVLTVSIGNNSATKGSKAQYFIGSFDGSTFKDDNGPANVSWTDYGKDFYAAVSYSDIPKEDGRRIWLGWMSNWRYPFAMPTGVWKGNMSIPRVLKLRKIPDQGIRLVQEPIEELKTLRGNPRKVKKMTLSPGRNPLEGVKGTNYELEAEFDAGSGHSFGAKVRAGEGGQETVIRYDPKMNVLLLDRSHSGVTDFEGGFAEAMAAPLVPKDGKIKLRIFVDETTVEVFANDGEAVLSAIVFPDPTSDDIGLFADGDVTLNHASYYPMRTVWRDEDPDAKKPLRILLSRSILHLKAGEEQPIETAVVPFPADQRVNWSSSDPSVAAVGGSGETGETGVRVKGMKPGKAEMTATSEDGKVRASLNVFVE